MPVARLRRRLATIAATVPMFASLGALAQPAGQPPGAEKSPATRALELGSRLLQKNSPLAPMDIYLVGFHPLKDDPLPTGDPRLAWSFSRDGEIQPPLLQERDRAMDIDSARIREDRADLRELARPQAGVDALDGRFKRPTQPIPGVVDLDGAPR